MSHLLKALRSLETRGAAFAPPPDGLEVQDAVSKTAVLAVEEAIELMADGGPAAGPTQEPPARIKPRPAPRVKPRRTTQSPVDLFAGRPLIERLGQAARPSVAKKLDDAVAESAASAAQSQQYTLAPAVVVNQAALDAGAALAREMAVPAALPEPAQASAPAVAPLPVSPLRTPTLFEQRIREALLHPARSRPFAELVQRLRQDFRGSQERSLLFTGIGRASRGDEMLAHVAALFAEQGERVLLVDADFERSGLSSGFGAGTLGGLQNAIVAPRTWQDHLLTTSFPNLSFLPNGRGSLNVATVADTLTSLIPKLEAEFPLVLIDGGQSSGSLLTPLARACDATYFVIRLGATDAKEAQGALKSFRAAGARVMGCVAVMAND
ncbi:MAG: hypothetical protein ACR2FY_14015 [Pirellulaceae bacterium]